MKHKSNIVILSVNAGTGHMRAAEALKKAFAESHPEFQVTILDTFSYASPYLQKLLLGSYIKMLDKAPSIYGFLYNWAEKKRPLSGFIKSNFYKFLTIFSAARLLKFINTIRPEAVICTHPFPLGVLSGFKKQGTIDYFIAGAVTDLDLHSYWVFPEVDLYLVGTDKLLRDLIGLGIPPSKVHVTGIPIDTAFGGRIDRKETLEAYNLSTYLITILIMGGGLGMGPLEDCVKTLGALEERCQLIVVTGKNEQLKAKIEQIAPCLKNPVCTLGYVNNVHQLMAAADVMVSKAGGLSCAEALASRLPLFIMDSLPGQEERNSQFLASAGSAMVANNAADLGEKIIECLKKPSRLKKMSEAAACIGRPDAARDSAMLIKTFLEKGE